MKPHLDVLREAGVDENTRQAAIVVNQHRLAEAMELTDKLRSSLAARSRIDSNNYTWYDAAITTDVIERLEEILDMHFRT